MFARTGILRNDDSNPNHLVGLFEPDEIGVAGFRFSVSVDRNQPGSEEEELSHCDSFVEKWNEVSRQKISKARRNRGREQ